MNGTVQGSIKKSYMVHGEQGESAVGLLPVYLFSSEVQKCVKSRGNRGGERVLTEAELN